ncbi:MAG: 23S rRNA (uracil(1939)-C(5))-methyltransferase RlmD [Cytophagales bacterium]|nr:23S rRNA (uracil(1939)-C(5))-methyltransferase RlmD [Cytophagales bacterium]
MNTSLRYNDILTNITIADMAAEGKCIAKTEDGAVIFVPHTAPGDVADIKILKKDKKYYEGVAVHFHHYSPQRTSPACTHFGTCGGCKWQHIPYDVQIAYKQRQVHDALVRIGNLKIHEIMPIIGSKSAYYYRNKLEFTFTNQRWLHIDDMGNDNVEKRGLGFHIPGRFDKVLDLEQCHLQVPVSDSIRNEIKKFAIAHNISFYDARARSGLLRILMIRTGTTGEVMVLIQFHMPDYEHINKLLDYVRAQFPTITSLLYAINTKANDTLEGVEVHTHSGKSYIMEKLENLHFKISPKSFFQTNTSQAHILYQKVRELAQLSAHDTVYDLYTGTGTIAIFLAQYCKKIIGIEYVPAAVADADENATLNSIRNATFVAGDIAKVLNDDFVAHHGIPDVVITDPPRAGMHAYVVEMLLKILPPVIIYVSCNPATQARDLAMMSDKYEIVAVQPVDMFPHTHHVESVVKLKLS